MLEALRIAHVAPVILPVPPASYGGTERVIADLASAQAAMGHRPVIFAGADSAPGDLELRSGFHSLAWHRERARDVPPGLVAELEAAQLAMLHGVADAFDIVHLHGSAHASGSLKASGVPIVRTIHWRADEADHRHHFASFPDERIIAVSASQAQSVPAGSLAGIVHHGIASERFTLGEGAGGYLAFIGRMTDQKRPDRAIGLARGAGMPLNLAGPVDPGNPDYFRNVVEPELDAAVRHVGNVTDVQKQSFLANAAALVFPIDWPEPFGLVMIEAMACGTPVIAWRRGSVPEVVEDGVTGIVVDDMEEARARLPEALALDRKAIRARFEARFTSLRMAHEICALYGACAGRPESAPKAGSPRPQR